jgi:hypothetical protein
LNRNFDREEVELFPEIRAVNGLVSRVRRLQKVRYLVDLHGHSARKNIFAYGGRYDIGSVEYLHIRALPKLLSSGTSGFRYNECIFEESRVKKKTARVFYSQRYKINCLTIEQSYGIIDNEIAGVVSWRKFGMELAKAVLEFGRLYQQGKEDALAGYLSE